MNKPLNWLTFAGLAVLCAVLYSSVLPVEVSTCGKVYMYPSYARITGFDESLTPLAKKYSLYLYREQNKNEDSLTGVPLLFIPGNAGSYRQVRSIASESAAMYYAGFKEGDPIDFFSAEFNEELTAFHGRSMLDQAEYLNEAVKFILSLYRDLPNAPKSVILLGHSMGGVVARVMLTLPNYAPESVNTILTLSCPHAVAPVTFDSDIVNVYKTTDVFWRAAFYNSSNTSLSQLASERLSQVSLVSITGGLLDTVLPADYTTLEGLVPPSNGFSVYTTGIPQVWTTVDHLAIVWCDQVRKAVAKTLLGILDKNSHAKTMALPERMSVFRKTLLPDYTEPALPVVVKLDEEKLGDLQIIRISKDSTLTYFSENAISPVVERQRTLALCKSSPSSHLADLDLTTNSTQRVVALECIDGQTTLAPRPDVSFRECSYGGSADPLHMARIEPNELSQYDVVLTSEPVDLFQTNSQNFSFWQLAFGSSFHLGNPSHTKINIPWSSLLVFRVVTGLESVLMRQTSGDETKWHSSADSKIISHGGSSPFCPFKRPLPPLELTVFHSEPATFRITIDWFVSLKGMALKYRLTIVAMSIFVTTATLFLQFLSFFQKNKFPSFLEGLQTLCRHFWSLSLMTSVLSYLTSREPLQKLLGGSTTPAHVNSFFLGVDEPFLWFIGPVFLLVSLALVHLVALIVTGIAQLTAKLTPARISKARKYSKKRLAASVALLTAVSLYIPYQFAYVICCCLQAVKAIRAVKSGTKSTGNLQLSILILMLWILPIELPIVVVLIHNFSVRWSTPFSSHHNFLAIMPILLYIQREGKAAVPKSKVARITILSGFLYFAVFALLFGTTSLFWLHHLFNSMTACLLFVEFWEKM